MKIWLKWGIISGLTVSVVGIVYSLTIKTMIDPFELIKHFSLLNNFNPFPYKLICASNPTRTCLYSILRMYNFLLEFVFGFFIGVLLNFVYGRLPKKIR